MTKLAKSSIILNMLNEALEEALWKFLIIKKYVRVYFLLRGVGTYSKFELTIQPRLSVLFWSKN